MQAPKQIYFRQASPKGSKIYATIEGDDLPNIIQIKGTNDIAEVRRRRDHERPDFGRDNDNEDRNDDDEYDRDERGCHKSTTGTWESKNKYTSLKVTLLLIKKRNCTRVVQVANYDAQGKLIVETPASTIKDGTILPVDRTVEIHWTSVTEVMVKEYIAESKLSSATAWNKFDTEPPMGAGTAYVSVDIPPATGSYDYRLTTVFVDDSSKVLLNSTLSIVVPAGEVEVKDFSAVFNPDTGNIDVAYTSVKETSLVSYILQLKGSTAPDSDYIDVLSTAAIAVNHNYAIPLFANTGDYSIRLLGLFNDTNKAVAAEADVLVPVF